MITERTVILAKKETGYGTDATPTTADGILAYEPDIRPLVGVNDRNPAMATLSQQTPVIGAVAYELSFHTFLKGSGTAGTAPEVSPLWQACGYSETLDAGTDVTYAPASSSHGSATIYCYLDGIRYDLVGARGNVEMTAEAGALVRLNWTISALFELPTDQAIVTGVYDATKPEACKGATFTIAGYAYVCQALNFNKNNNVTLRPSIAGTDGYAGVEITGRNPSGSFNPEAILRATKDLWSEWNAGTPGALNFVLGATAGNIATVTAPAMVYREVTPGDRDGMAVYDVPCTYAMSSGDDEISIVYS
jgi:hypothetical protein